MSQKPQKPRRTPLQRKSQQYSKRPTPPASSQQPTSYPHQQQPLPAAPPPRHNTPLPQQQQQVERVVVVQQTNGSNQVRTIINIITWPFRKFFGALLWLVRVIISAMIQSIVSAILGVIMLILVTVLIGVYGFALVDSNMDAIQALSLSLERIVDFFQTMVGIQESIPTDIPSNP